MKLRDYVGRLVRLQRRCTTNGGDTWDEGEVVRVVGTWRSGVSVEPPDPDPYEDARRGISQLHRSMVRLVGPLVAMETYDGASPTSAVAVARRETERAIAEHIRQAGESMGHDGCDHGHCEACFADRMAAGLENGSWRGGEA